MVQCVAVPRGACHQLFVARQFLGEVTRVVSQSQELQSLAERFPQWRKELLDEMVHITIRMQIKMCPEYLLNVFTDVLSSLV